MSEWLREEAQEVVALRGAVRHFVRATSAACRGARLTPRLYELLLTVAAAPGGIDVGDLPARLEARQPAVSDLVRSARESGLVERRRLPQDRRRAVLTLTAEGEERLARVLAALRREREALRESLLEQPERTRPVDAA